MARIRTIKPEFWGDSKTARCSRDARLLFIALLNESDDEGRQLGSVRRITGTCFPHDDDVSTKMVDSWLTELEAATLIRRYDVDGVAYILICGFTEHQKINRPSPSRLPSPREPSLNTHGGLTEPSLPDLGSGSRSTEVEVAPNTSAREASVNRDVLWDALMEACAIAPNEITSSSRGAYNKALKDLRSVDATPQDVYQRAAVYREKWPDTSCTPTALARHWAECDPSRQALTPSAGTANVAKLRALRAQGGVA